MDANYAEKLTILGAVLAALGLGYRKVWCFYYVVDEVKASAESQIAQLRSELAKAEKREEEMRTALRDQRVLLAEAVLLAKKSATA